ncbi:MAG: TolB family protein, partial [Pirellulaceae bacterium]
LAFQQTTVDLEKNESQTAIFVVPTDGSQPPRQLTSSLKKDSRPRFSPDGKYLVFQSNRSGSMPLWLIGLHGGEARQLTSLSTEASNAIWSPDGRKLAFVSSVRPEYSEKPFTESDLANREANELAAKNTPSARIFQRLFYRHWDSYVDGKRQHLMVIRLRPGANGLEVDGTPHDATPGDRDAFPTSSTSIARLLFVSAAVAEKAVILINPRLAKKADI